MGTRSLWHIQFIWSGGIRFIDSFKTLIRSTSIDSNNVSGKSESTSFHTTKIYPLAAYFLDPTNGPSWSLNTFYLPSIVPERSVGLRFWLTATTHCWLSKSLSWTAASEHFRVSTDYMYTWLKTCSRSRLSIMLEKNLLLDDLQQHRVFWLTICPLSSMQYTSPYSWLHSCQFKGL